MQRKNAGRVGEVVFTGHADGDYIAQVDIDLNSGLDGSLYFRYLDPANWYRVRLDENKDAHLQKMVAGVLSTIASGGFSTAGSYLTKVKCSGGSISVWVNGSAPFATQSDGDLAWGNVAVSGWQAKFDDLKVGYDNNADNDTDDGGDDVTLDIDFSSGSFAPTYDHPGNLTKDFDHEFVYDAWNNLVKVRSAFDADVTVATYAFFADDRRASRTVTNRGGLNGVTYYFYDGHEVIEERDGSGAVVQQYLFGPQHIDELLLTLGENGANWVHQDANWNIIGTTTSTGQVAERYTYDPYGRLRARRLTGFGDTDADGLVGSKDVGDWEDTQGEGGVYDRKLDANLDGVNDAYDAAAFDKTVSLPGGRLTVPNRRFSPSERWAGYTARTLDPESGVMHYRARAYSPELRRFGQRDPLSYVDGGSLYEYVGGSPLNYSDPSGLRLVPTPAPQVNAEVAVATAATAGAVAAGGGTAIAAPVAIVAGCAVSVGYIVYQEVAYTKGMAKLARGFDWTDVGPPPPPPPPRRPRLCSDRTFERLNNAMRAACNSPRSCAGGGYTPEELVERIKNGSRCVTARIRLDKACFGGSDPDHLRLIEAAKKVLIRCQRKLWGPLLDPLGLPIWP